MAEGFFVFAARAEEGVEHVAGGVPRQAAEVEVEGVEAGAQMAAFVVVPGEGQAVATEVLDGVGETLFMDWRATRRSIVEERGRMPG